MKTFLNAEPDPVFRSKNICNKMFYGVVKFHFYWSISWNRARSGSYEL